mmetsp:Transcript_42457/g.99436  ORF Transcript_42457/g.99436 Transcript_42457/m.99436 type:complete len:228 (+) Transcript_42457:248-931(+)
MLSSSIMQTPIPFVWVRVPPPEKPPSHCTPHAPSAALSAAHHRPPGRLAPSKQMFHTRPPRFDQAQEAHRAMLHRSYTDVGRSGARESSGRSATGKKGPSTLVEPNDHWPYGSAPSESAADPISSPIADPPTGSPVSPPAGSAGSRWPFRYSPSSSSAHVAIAGRWSGAASQHAEMMAPIGAQPAGRSRLGRSPLGASTKATRSASPKNSSKAMRSCISSHSSKPKE